MITAPTSLSDCSRPAATNASKIARGSDPSNICTALNIRKERVSGATGSFRESALRQSNPANLVMARISAYLFGPKTAAKPVASTMSRVSPIVTVKATDSRLSHIDGLRGLAILLVLLTHTWVFNGALSLALHVHGYSIVLASLPAIGYVGVDLFLVLSGFCLAWPFMRDHSYRDRMSVGRFWMRRVRRIVPAYYASIIVVVAISIGFDYLIPSRLTMSAPHFAKDTFVRDLWPHLLFVHNFFVDRVSAINGSYWSLALEFQLYMLFPIVLEATFRWGPWRVLGLALAIQLAYRIFLESYVPTGLNQFEFILPKAMLGRIVDFACGVAAAQLVADDQQRHFARPGPRLLLANAVACLLTAFGLTYGRLRPS